MIENTLTGAGQFSDPINVPPDHNLTIQVREVTATLSATMSIQQILDACDPARPDDNSSDWVTIASVEGDTVPINNNDHNGPGWYRVAILSGEWSSGSAGIRLITAPK